MGVYIVRDGRVVETAIFSVLLLFTISEMTYNVLSGTLNLTYSQILLLFFSKLQIQSRNYLFDNWLSTDSKASDLNWSF